MAKVTGPLHSDGASGQFAKALVFATNKGRNIVRKYVIPVNPMVEAQGDQRIMLGGAGKVAGKVTVAGDINGQFATLGFVQPGQSKQSQLVSYILKNVLVDASTYATVLSAYTSHTAKATFDSEAATLGLATVDNSYAAIAPFTGGAQLYVLAKALIAIGLTGAPFSDALASWDATDIAALVAAL